MKQEIKDQIRKMAAENYSGIRGTDSNYGHKINAFVYGGEAVIERLDVDDDKLINILDMVAHEQVTTEQAKQSILDAIRISG